MANNIIPQLRFSEFDDSWHSKYLEAISYRGTGHTPDKKKPEYYNGGIKWISLADSKLLDNGYINETAIEISQLGIENSSAVLHPKGTVLLSRDAGVGKSAVMGFDMAVSQHFVVWNGKKDELDNWFLYYKLQILKPLFERMAVGNTIKTIGMPFFKNLKITIPKIEEQTKIANFLTAIDKRITLLQKKKAEFEQYKKGVMQKLFSQSIRFKDENGDDFPDWEEKKLGEIGTFQTSSVDKLSKEDEEQVYLVNYMNVYRHENISNSTRSNLQIVTAKENQIQSSDLRKGDILFTPSSETPTDIGHSVVIFEDLENTLFSYHLMRFRPSVNLDLLYSHYFCNIPSVLKQLSSFATGSTRFTISVGNFSKVKVQLPSINEQIKIANFLSSIDKSIENIGYQIEDSINFKQGLLQKMFV